MFCSRPTIPELTWKLVHRPIIKLDMEPDFSKTLLLSGNSQIYCITLVICSTYRNTVHLKKSRPTARLSNSNSMSVLCFNSTITKSNYYYVIKHSICIQYLMYKSVILHSHPGTLLTPQMLLCVCVCLDM